MDWTTVEKLLTTTRSVRKRLDLTRTVEPGVIAECLDIAVQAPTASNRQKWHFVVIIDAGIRAQVAAFYKRSFDHYIDGARESHSTDTPHNRQTNRVLDSAVYLAENMQHVPVLIVPCQERRVENASQEAQAAFYGSILPATWSLMLALRARGLGSAWTTLHLRYEKEVAALLGIPDNMTQAALLPVAYYTGDDFRPAKRQPAREITYWDHWGETKT